MPEIIPTVQLPFSFGPIISGTPHVQSVVAPILIDLMAPQGGLTQDIIEVVPGLWKFVLDIHWVGVGGTGLFPWTVNYIVASSPQQSDAIMGFLNNNITSPRTQEDNTAFDLLTNFNFKITIGNPTLNAGEHILVSGSVTAIRYV